MQFIRKITGNYQILFPFTISPKSGIYTVRSARNRFALKRKNLFIKRHTAVDHFVEQPIKPTHVWSSRENAFQIFQDYANIINVTKKLAVFILLFFSKRIVK